MANLAAGASATFSEVSMKKARGLVSATLTIIGATVVACSTLYTEADLEEAERREDARVRAAVVNDMELGAEGGANMEAIEEEKEAIERRTER